MNEPVPYIAHESIIAKMERTIRRLFVLLIITVVMIFASNALWLYFWNQYEYEDSSETYTYDQDGEGVNIIGPDNEVNNGAKTDN